MRRYPLLLIITVLMLQGCSGFNLEDLQTTVIRKPNGEVITTYGAGQYLRERELVMVKGCRDWLAKKEADENARFYALPKNQQTMVLNHRATMDMIEKVFGRGPVDPCRPGANAWDAYIAEVQSKNKAVSQIIAETGATGRAMTPWVAGAYVLDKAFDAAGDKAGGDIVGRDNQYAGDDLTNSGNSNSRMDERHTQIGTDYSATQGDASRTDNSDRSRTRGAQ